MIFYRDISAAGLDIAPNQAMKSVHKVIRNFRMPSTTVPEFRRKAVIIAVGGVYDPRIHLNKVVMPVLKKWRIFEREDFTGEAAWMCDDLGLLIEELEEAGEKFDVSKQRYLEREARKAERITGQQSTQHQRDANGQREVTTLPIGLNSTRREPARSACGENGHAATTTLKRP